MSFGRVAELYEQARPSYPTTLVDDVLTNAGLGAGEAILEVGAGTGKATRLFAARGHRVVALEPSAEMAGIARRISEDYPSV
ncbi:MAG TPA: class I SAM-dependent methyltransferase, partial [Solirubrobacteraceae bacterium]